MSGPPPRENVTEHVARPGPTLRPAQTVADARDAIRRGSPKAGILYFYVTEDSGRLVGVMPTRTLLVEPDSKVVGDVMLRDVIAIPHTATVLDACEFFILHRLLAFPVVDDEGKLLGTVDVTLYTDELAGLDGEGDAHAGRAVTDDLFQLVGVHLADARPKSPFAAFRGRFPWLLANVAGGLCAAFLTGLFEAELEKAVALALFVPVVLALAESVAIQSVSLALERLHGGRPTLWKLWTRAYEEFGTGLLLGGGAGLLVAGVALAWLGQPEVAACLVGGIVGGTTCAAVIGGTAPTLIRLVSAKPHVAAGPIVLALTDMATLGIYFSLARRLFG